MPAKLYIGLMSGTSLDAIDCVVCSFGEAQTCEAVKLLATHSHPFPAKLRNQLIELVSKPEEIVPEELGSLDEELGHVYALAVNALLESAEYDKEKIAAIGNHGQTVLHKPDADPGFSLQLGDGNIIAKETGITTVVDFRSADIALGGQGAPLAPVFHHFVFARPGETKAVVNIGGIANVSLLAADGSVTGFDTGPGNTLLDVWSQEHRGEPYDAGGAWATGGSVMNKLLEKMLADDYFRMPPPKSTGREYFNRAWLDARLKFFDRPLPADVQATLSELTARTIADALRATTADEVLICGGGAFNCDLMRRLAAQLPDKRVAAVPREIIPADWVEAAAFAWLARARLHEQPAGLPSVTGASAPAVLGKVCRPSEA